MCRAIFRLRRTRLAFAASMVFAGMPGIPRAFPARSRTRSAAEKARQAPKAKESAKNASTVQPPAGMQVVQVGGYPELQVDGKPFFIHSAAFFYYRIPRDVWDSTLDLYRRTGINTLDIYIPWNWHEPREGQFDFDGHTNPRRDLRTLLSLIAEKGFRLIARTGPEILNEWRHGGYPGWLLDRPEYKMDPFDWIEGRYSPLDGLNTRNADAAAQGWLDNPTHMQQTALWMAAVGRELAPYSSHKLFHVEQQTPNGVPAHDISGPLLFVQVGDDFAINRTNYAGPAFWRYVEDLAKMLKADGLDVPVFINPTDMRVSAAGSALDPPIGAMGQWYMHPRLPTPEGPPLLTPRDASEIELFTEELKTQPDFPPVMIEYQAGWYAPADDDRPLPSRISATLLSLRLLIANGIHGFNYFPLQDTYTPAGYSVPWANRSYRWDAALSPDGDPQPRMAAVERNARFLDLWGPLLAASHKRADFGIIYPLGAYPQQALKSEDILNVSESVMRIERLAELNLLSTELLDPQYQPVEQLLRDPLLLLPVIDPAKPQFQLSDRAQQEIVDYVRRGGTLLVFPARPPGTIIDELWKDAPALSNQSPDKAIRADWKFGDGQVIESSSDFYSWISLDHSFSQNRADPTFSWAAKTMAQFLGAANVRPALKLSTPASDPGGLIASEIVTDGGTSLLGKRTGGKGFLSLTNISASAPVQTTIEILSPFVSARSLGSEYSSFNITVPPRESLLLPLSIPLCAMNSDDEFCDSTIPEAGAEFLGARREDKNLDLAFYVPARAEVNLHLPQKPARIWLDQTDTHPDSTWTPASHELHLAMPKGAAPDFRRTLKLEMPHARNFKENGKHPSRAPSEDLNVFVANSVALPISGSAFLRTFPALIVPDPEKKINVLLLVQNRNDAAGAHVDLSFSKPLHGEKTVVVGKGGTASDTLEFRQQDFQTAGIPSPPGHLFHTVIEARVGRDHRAVPLVFLLHSPSAQEHYRFDFDRDGADEWVLENDLLRLIVSPESGGRVIALSDKLSGENLSTSVGLLRDAFSFTENPPGINPARKRGQYGLSNRPYIAQWAGSAAHPVLRLHYHAPYVFPAGADIEKSVRLERAASVRVHYRVALNSDSGANATSASQSQSFVAINSFPAQERADSSTRFCWHDASPQKPASPDSDGSDPDETCRTFVRDGAPILVPQGISSVRVRTPGRPEIELAWDCSSRCGQLTIDQKYFSALFRLQFPPLVSGAAAAGYSLRIRVLNAP